MNIGQRVKEGRLTLKITQQQLGRIIGVTPQHISAIEQDKRAPSLPSLTRLAEELGVTIDYLVTGKSPVIAEPIPAIKGDKKLDLKAKNGLITIIQHLYEASSLKWQEQKQ